jgi:hypothetical protein
MATTAHQVTGAGVITMYACPVGGKQLVDVMLDDGSFVRYEPNLSSMLARLAEQFQLVWATSWESTANELLAPLFRLPPLPYFSDGSDEGLEGRT